MQIGSLVNLSLHILNLQPLKYKVATSNDSREYYEQYRSQTLFGEDVLPIKLGMEEMPSIDSETEDRSPEGKKMIKKKE